MLSRDALWSYDHCTEHFHKGLFAFEAELHTRRYISYQPVSYTHLDVYKRQALSQPHLLHFSQFSSFLHLNNLSFKSCHFAKVEYNSIAVSYTHLSLPELFPGFPVSVPQWLMCLFSLALGGGAIWLLSSQEA